MSYTGNRLITTSLTGVNLSAIELYPTVETPTGYTLGGAVVKRQRFTGTTGATDGTDEFTSAAVGIAQVLLVRCSSDPSGHNFFGSYVNGSDAFYLFQDASDNSLHLYSSGNFNSNSYTVVVDYVDA